jgi:hypothetical protein
MHIDMEKGTELGKKRWEAGRKTQHSFSMDISDRQRKYPIWTIGQA